jgi:S1-C subfamily serine protease
MKIQLLAALVAAFLIIPSASAQGTLFDSVAPIAQIYYDEAGNATFDNVCTATSINKSKHYWLTAYHCIADAAPMVKHYIKGEPVGYEMKDPTNDLAILSTPAYSAPAIKMATVAPVTGDPVTVIGHPLGQIFPVVTVGQIAAEKTVFKGMEVSFTLFQVPGAPGSSGSAVFNSRNEIISVIQRGSSPNSWGPVMAGCTFEKLQSLALWWEK